MNTRTPEHPDSELIEALPDIERLAGKIWRDHGGGLRQGPEMIDDLRSEGVLAFLKAMKTYDHTRGTSPIQYTYRTVLGAMVDAVRKTPIVGNTAYGWRPAVSLDEFMDEAKTIRIIDLLTSENGSEEVGLIQADANALVNKAIQALQDRERRIAIALFLEGKNGEEIGLELGITGSRISQLKMDILAKLRATLTAMIDDEGIQEAPLQAPIVTRYIVGENGVVNLPDGREAVELYAYANYMGHSPRAFRDLIKKIGTRPISGIMGTRSANSRECHRPLYSKRDIDRHAARTCQLDARGITTLPDGREAVCITPYGRHIKIPSLGKIINTHRLEPIYPFVGEIIRPNGKKWRPVKLYMREDVDMHVKRLRKNY